MEHKYVLFDKQVPEFGMYRAKEDFNFLVSRICDFDGDLSKMDTVRKALQLMPIGVITMIGGKRVVKVEDYQ